VSHVDTGQNINNLSYMAQVMANHLCEIADEKTSPYAIPRGVLRHALTFLRSAQQVAFMHLYEQVPKNPLEDYVNFDHISSVLDRVRMGEFFSDDADIDLSLEMRIIFLIRFVESLGDGSIFYERRPNFKRTARWAAAVFAALVKMAEEG
jgi:hypothetical protein